MVAKHPTHSRGDSVRLIQDVSAGQCLIIVNGGAKVITSKQTSSPWIDCVALCDGEAGDTIPVAQQYGVTFDIPDYILPRGGLLYLGKNGFLKGAPEGSYSVIVGRYVDKHKFVFNPKLTGPITTDIPNSSVIISIDAWGEPDAINVGDIINYKGDLYVNLTGDLSSNPPDEDETNWTAFTSADEPAPSFVIKILDDWSQVGDVFAGDVINYNGALYVSLTGAATEPPSEDWEVLGNTAPQPVNSYIHLQQTLSDEWIIDHNLDQRIVSVDIVNQADEIMFVQPNFVSPNRLKLKFAMPVVGQATIRR